MALQLLWKEYKQQESAEGYQYSQFCDLYRQWARALGVWMRQEQGDDGETVDLEEPSPFVAGGDQDGPPEGVVRGTREKLVEELTQTGDNPRYGKRVIARMGGSVITHVI